MKNIIFPTDFSACADNALSTAVTFAKMTDAKLYVIHVYHPVHTFETLQDAEVISDSVPEVISSKMELIKKKLSRETGLNYDCQVVQGWLGDVIHAMVKKTPSSLIIMGTEGLTKSISFSYSSRTLSISEHNDIPLLSIPSSFKGNIAEKQEFVFPVDFEQINDWEILDSFKEIAQKFEAKVHIFCIIDNMEDEAYIDFQKRLFVRLEDYFDGVEFEVSYSRKKNIAEAIQKFSESKRASLIALVRHHRSFFENMLHNSVTKEMLLYSQIPCLIMPDKKSEMNLSYIINYW